jgi:hypothetical protein
MEAKKVNLMVRDQKDWFTCENTGVSERFSVAEKKIEVFNKV